MFQNKGPIYIYMVWLINSFIENAGFLASHATLLCIAVLKQVTIPFNRPPS